MRVREPAAPFRLQDLEISYAERAVSRAGKSLRLTPREYALLRELSLQPGPVLGYDELLRRIWGVRRDHDLRPVHSLGKRLRDKLGENDKQPRFLFAERSVGYRLGLASKASSAEEQT